MRLKFLTNSEGYIIAIGYVESFPYYADDYGLSYSDWQEKRLVDGQVVMVIPTESYYDHLNGN